MSANLRVDWIANDARGYDARLKWRRRSEKRQTKSVIDHLREQPSGEKMQLARIVGERAARRIEEAEESRSTHSDKLRRNVEAAKKSANAADSCELSNAVANAAIPRRAVFCRLDGEMKTRNIERISGDERRDAAATASRNVACNERRVCGRRSPPPPPLPPTHRAQNARVAFARWHRVQRRDDNSRAERN